LPEKEHPITANISKLFPVNRLQMEQSRLLMLPDYLCRSL
jgi:hypothetical protein